MVCLCGFIPRGLVEGLLSEEADNVLLTVERCVPIHPLKKARMFQRQYKVRKSVVFFCTRRVQSHHCFIRWRFIQTLQSRNHNINTKRVAACVAVFTNFPKDLSAPNHQLFLFY